MSTRQLTLLIIVGFVIIAPTLATTTSADAFQQISHTKRYSCNGETVVVGRCRHESDTPEMPRTKPEDDYCMVYYLDRPKQGGFTVQKVELLGDIVKKLQACGALNGPSSTAAQPSRPATTTSPAAKSALVEGDRYLQAKDYARGLEAYKRAVSLDPNLENAYWGIVVCAGAQGDGKTRMAALQRLNVMKPHNYDILFEIGVFGVSDGLYNEAIPALVEARRLKPTSTDPVNHLGLAYAGLNRNAEAIATFKEAIGIDPKVGRPHANLGNLYVNLGRNQEAVQELLLAIPLEPTYARAYKGLGMAYARLGRKAEALDVYRKLQTIDNKEAQALYAVINEPVTKQPLTGASTTSTPNTGRKPAGSPSPTGPNKPTVDELRAQADSLYEEKNYAAAIDAYQKTLAFRLEPAVQAEIHYKMGYAYSELKAYPNAILHLRTSVRLNPGNADNHFGLGYLYYNDKQFPQALASFQEAIRLKPTNPEFQYWVGETFLVGLKDGEKAIPYFRESLRLRPNDARTLGELGSAYYLTMDYLSAIEAFKAALRLKPQNADFLYGLGLSYSVTGRKAEATRVYQALQRVDAKRAKELYDAINQ